MFLADSVCICPSSSSEKGLGISADCGFLDSSMPPCSAVSVYFIYFEAQLLDAESVSSSS